MIRMTIFFVAVLAAFPVLSLAGEEQPEQDIKAQVRKWIETVTAEDAPWPGPEGREAAIRSLTEHPEESSGPVLDALEESRGTRPRLWILLCVNSFKDMAIFGPRADTIVKLLDDQSFGTKFWAIKTVAKMKASSAVPALTKLLQSDTYLFREAAATALGRIGGQVPVEELIKLLKDPEHMVRRAVVEALGELKPPGSKAHLIDAIKDDEHNLVVRRAIVGALEKITGSSFDIDPSEWYAPGAGDKRAEKIKEWLEKNK
jgi:hypothetical protein